MKKNKKLIDLVIPCYNTRATLKRALSSVAMQTISDSIKVILFDDNSTELYTDIVKPFSKLLDILVVNSETNVGPGAARRLGMQAGNSPYIMFMDSDDTFQNAFAVQELYDGIVNNNLDALNSIFLEELENKSFVKHEGDWVWVFGKIYKREFIEANKIYFNDTRANEDTGFNAVITSCGKIGYLTDITYIWHYKKDSITRKDEGIYRFTGLEGWFENMIWSALECKRVGADDKKYQTKVVSNMINSYFFCLDLNYDKDKRVDLEKFRSWAHKFWEIVYKPLEIPDTLLQETYKALSVNRNSLSNNIPKITLYQYIGWVGENYGE